MNNTERVHEDDLLTVVAHTTSQLSGKQFLSTDFYDAMYDLTSIGLLHVYEKCGLISKAQRAQISLLFNKIINLQFQATAGDCFAEKQIRVISKSAFPPVMIRRPKGNVRASTLPIFDDFLEKYRSSRDFEIATEVRRLASQLSFIVQPICGAHRANKRVFDETVTEDSEFSLTPNQRKFNECMKPANACCCRNVTLTTKVRLSANSFAKQFGVDLYDEIDEVLTNMSTSERKRLTLLGLAKKVYLHRQSQLDPDSKKTERTVDRALRTFVELENDIGKTAGWLKLPIFNGDEISYLPR
jgi:hypothetical protein